MSLRRIRLQADLMPLKLHVLVGDYSEAKSWIARRFTHEWDDQPSSGRANVLQSPDGVGWECVMWMPRFRRGNAFDAGTLSHEALHIVWRLLEHLGSYDEETHCYMLQWIVDEATRRLMKSR